MKEILDELSRIQKELSAPKSQHNKFGNYDYRSAEDILGAVKPLLVKCVLLVSDDLVEIAGRHYVKATASLILSATRSDSGIATGTQEKQEISATAFARESAEKKGMDVSQITGSASSYARKYALNGLFAIDDAQDPDARDNSNVSESKSAPSTNSKKINVNKDDLDLVEAVLNIDSENEFYQSVAKGLKQYGKLTDKQRDSLKDSAVQSDPNLPF